MLILPAAAAVAAAANWSIISPDVATIATGIAVNADGKTAFLPGDQNGVGAQILRSTDGGVTWNSVNSPSNLLYLDVASFGSDVIASALFQTDFSVDGGLTFNASNGGGGGSQCTRNLFNHDVPAGFGMAGQFGLPEVKGVAISLDYGATFTAFDANLTSDSRYAAFPDEQVWYVAAGDWPNNDADLVLPASKSLVKRLTQKLALVKDETSGEHSTMFTTRRRTAREAASRELQSSGSSSSGSSTSSGGGGGGGSYSAQLSKTTDGGSTWTSLVNVTGEFYFNGIECIDDTHCCVVGEADDGAYEGAYIWCTTDGLTFQQTLNVTTPGASLLDIAAVSATEYWAVGGLFGDLGPQTGWFYHSVDAGVTWTLDSTIDGQYGSAIDCVPAVNRCWATTLDILQEASVASYGM